jgi:hypothetical protein
MYCQQSIALIVNHFTFVDDDFICDTPVVFRRHVTRLEHTVGRRVGGKRRSIQHKHDSKPQLGRSERVAAWQRVGTRRVWRGAAGRVARTTGRRQNVGGSRRPGALVEGASRIQQRGESHALIAASCQHCSIGLFSCFHYWCVYLWLTLHCCSAWRVYKATGQVSYHHRVLCDRCAG